MTVPDENGQVADSLTQRPSSITISVRGWIIVGLCYVTWLGVYLVRRAQHATDAYPGIEVGDVLYPPNITVVILIFLFFGGCFLFFAFELDAGKRRARTALSIIGGISIPTDYALIITGDSLLGGFGIAMVAPTICAIMYMFDADSNRYLIDRRDRG